MNNHDMPFFSIIFFSYFPFFFSLASQSFFFFLSIYCMKIKKHTTRSIVENYWLVIFCFCFVLRRVFVRIGERFLIHSSVLGQDCGLQGGLFRATPRALFSGFPRAQIFRACGRACIDSFFLMTRTRNLQLFFECEV